MMKQPLRPFQAGGNLGDTAPPLKNLTEEDKLKKAKVQSRALRNSKPMPKQGV